MKSVKQTDILTGSIPKQLLLFFLPIWFGTLFQQLYNTADTLIVGNFVGTNALAAVGATGPFVNLLVGLFVGLCSGAGVVIAQSWGAHDPDAVDRQVHTALVLSAAVGALLTVLGLVTAAPMMRLLGTPDEILPDAALYLRIYFLGMIPQMLYNMGTNILRAIGDSKRPLYFLIAASLVNIVPPTFSIRFRICQDLRFSVPLNIMCSTKWAKPNSSISSSRVPAFTANPQYDTGDAEGRCTIRKPFGKICEK